MERRASVFLVGDMISLAAWGMYAKRGLSVNRIESATCAESVYLAQETPAMKGITMRTVKSNAIHMGV